MSTEALSTKDTSEQQEESQPTAEAKANVNQVQDNAECGAESSSSAGDDSSNHSAISDASIRPRRSSQDGAAAVGVGIQDSQESSACGGVSGTESQQGGATGGVDRQQSHESAASTAGSTESQQGGATGGVDRQQSHESAASTAGSTESQQGGATCGVDRQQSHESVASTAGSTESQLLDAVGGTSRRNSQTSGSIADSQETAYVCDSSSRTSLESDVAGGVSNSQNIQESPNDTESFEDVSLRPPPPAAAVRQSVQRSPRVDIREEVDERAHVDEELRNYHQCFNKCACVCDYLKPCSIWIRTSKIFMFLKMILLVLPLSASCMGAKYLFSCPVLYELPILVMMMGIAGVVLLSSSLALGLRRVLLPGVRPIYFKALIMASRVMLLALFSAGLERTYKLSPSFDPSDGDHYCDMVFYYYAYYTNFVVIGIAFLSIFIYVPSLNENIEYYG